MQATTAWNWRLWNVLEIMTVEVLSNRFPGQNVSQKYPVQLPSWRYQVKVIPFVYWHCYWPQVLPSSLLMTLQLYTFPEWVWDLQCRVGWVYLDFTVWLSPGDGDGWCWQRESPSISGNRTRPAPCLRMQSICCTFLGCWGICWCSE